METSVHRDHQPPEPAHAVTRVDKLGARLRSERLFELCWWWSLLTVATCVAKFAYLDQVYAPGAGSALDELVRRSGATSWRWLVGAELIARDVLQTALIALVVFACSSQLPRRLASAAHAVAALVLLLVLGANHLSFLELGTFASCEGLVTSWVWLTTKPEALPSYMRVATPLAGAAVAVWIALPSLLVRAAKRRPALGSLQPALAGIALAVIAAGLVLTPLASARFGEGAFPVLGYWSSVVRATQQPEHDDPARLEVPSQAALLAQYAKLAYPRQPSAMPQLLVPSVEARIRPRHVIVVGLETAPQAYYPLTTSSELSTFRRMSERAIISEQHYTTSPYTRLANFSMLSGLYAPPAGVPVRFGPMACDGFAAVLRQRGYETSYVDSWVLDWLPGSGERAQARMLGFDTVIDGKERRDDGVWEVLVRGEEAAFDTAYAKVDQAEDRGHKAAVFIGTMLGHAPWPAAPGDEHLDGRARIRKVTLVLDRLFAGLLARLGERGLSDEVLILVVGDHGLRLANEFESLGQPYTHSDLAYNVPFLLYAPGLIDHTLRVPFATSHVDIAPTLLHLLGVPTEGMLHHGGYVLDGRLAERVVFLPSSRLGPLEGYTWAGRYVTYHALSGAAQIGVGASVASMRPMSDASLTRTLPESLRTPLALLGAFDAHTTLVAGLMRRRGRSLPR